MSPHFDYIIVGAGCAGLSLAFHLGKSEILKDKKVLILDSERKESNDKTWCFWSKEYQPYSSAQSTSWNNLEFKSDNTQIQEILSELRYFHINSLEFYQETQTFIDNHTSFVIKYEQVSDVAQKDNAVEVHTSKGIYYGEYVFNSVIGLINQRPQKPGLFQHFFGKTIKTKLPVFQQAHVKLMDFSLPNKSTVQFGYLLPFNDYEALIEYTEFSPNILSDKQYEDQFNSYVEQLNLGDYTVLDTEKGQIPMSEFQFPRFNSSRVLNLGTAGGFTKPTTGYTFRNIQDDITSIVQSLEGNKPFKRLYSHKRYRFYDKLLLGIIRDEPHKVKGIMEKLFKNNSMARILRFLDERSSILDEIKIFSRLPWAPFLKQLFLK